MVNKVILVGRLGADPELRTTGSGMAVCNLRIATTHRRKNQSGDWEEATEWHAVIVFGKTAENAQRFLVKGRQVYVEGRLQTRKWQDKTGSDRWSTEVVCNELKFLGSKEGGGQRGESRGGGGNQGGGYGGNSGGYGGGNSQGGQGGGDVSIPF